MNQQLISSLLASTLALSLVATSATTVKSTYAEELVPQVSQTLSTTPASDFTFVNGTITKYNGKDAIVVIPSSINGQAVTKIGEKAFYNNDYILSVTIPGGVTEVGANAFYDCDNIMTWYIPASLKVIGYRAFYYCSKTENVYYGGTQDTKNKIICSEVGGTFFTTALWHYGTASAGTSNAPTSKLDTLNAYPTTAENQFSFANGVITKYNGSAPVVVIPSTINGQTVTKIGDKAFYNNDSIIALKIPNSVSEVGLSAFYDCDHLTDTSLPASISVLAENSFYYCSNSKNVYYGGSETNKNNIIAGEVGGSFFTNSNWHYNTISAGTANAPSSKLNTLLSYPTTAESQFSFANGEITKYNGGASVVVIPTTINGQTVKKIGEKAFYNNDNIVGLYIPNTITEIASNAFYDCDSLEEIAFPSSVSVIGIKGFYYCSATKNVYYSGSEANKASIIQTDVGGSFFTNAHWHYNTNLTQTTAAPPVVTSPTLPEVTVPEVTVPTTPEVTAPESGGTVNQYVDVNVTNWYYTYVQYVVNNNIMTGVGDSFMPDVTANRGTIADALANLSKEPMTASLPDSYVDVKGSGYEDVIAWCLENNIMSGYNSTTFGTLDNLKRQEFAVSLCAFAKKEGKYVEPSQESINSLARFPDTGDIAPWALNAVAWAVENNLITGSNGNLLPEGSVTRVALAIMMSAYNDNFGA